MEDSTHGDHGMNTQWLTPDATGPQSKGMDPDMRSMV